MRVAEMYYPSGVQRGGVPAAGSCGMPGCFCKLSPTLGLGVFQDFEVGVRIGVGIGLPQPGLAHGANTNCGDNAVTVCGLVW